jgi:hypothetical protein
MPLTAINADECSRVSVCRFGFVHDLISVAAFRRPPLHHRLEFSSVPGRVEVRPLASGHLERAHHLFVHRNEAELRKIPYAGPERPSHVRFAAPLRKPPHTGSLSAPLIKPPPYAWTQWIGPEALISQVRSTAPFLEPRLPNVESGRLIELGRRFLAYSRQLGEHPAPQPQHRGAVAGLLRFLPRLSSRYCRHVRAYRCRYQNPRHRLARIA